MRKTNISKTFLVNKNKVCKDFAFIICLLYTSDAADDPFRVELGVRRILKHKHTTITIIIYQQ
ncbi:hypothetical protein, partial [Metamycoplasma hyosynoviae]|uniref:hypothetical protein n=1 Tax=Metamycoplasma hyosynoviae TaxID=29559 RepID=UPI0023593039